MSLLGAACPAGRCFLRNSGLAGGCAVPVGVAARALLQAGSQTSSAAAEQWCGQVGRTH